MENLPGRRAGAVVVLLALLLVAVWLYQHPGVVTAKTWSWEEQLAMEEQMRQSALTNPEKVPAIDRNIPETETALFALG